MKLLFLLIAGGGPIHDQDEIAQRETWAKQDSQFAQIIWLRSHSSSTYKFQDRTLYVPCDSSFEGILEKTIIGLKWVLENVEFDYLIRSNTSTYFEVNSIIDRIDRVKEGQLGGTFETNRKHLSGFPKGYRYLNGSGLYMTRNSATILATLKPHTYRSSPDDLSIFKFMKGQGFSFIPIKRNNLDLHHIFCPYSQVRVKSWSNPELTVSRMASVDKYFQAFGYLAKIGSWLVVEMNEIRHSKITSRTFYRLLIRTFNSLRKK